MKRQLIACLSALILISGVASAQQGYQDAHPAPQPVTEPEVVAPQLRFTHTLKVGDEGAKVTDLQAALLDLGFGIPAGRTGYYGQQTKDAVAAFQSSQGLKTSGLFDEATLKKLEEVAPEAGLKVWQQTRPGAVATRPMAGQRGVRALVDLSEHRLTVYKNDGTVERVFPIASGAYATPTDTGLKVVYDKVADPTPIAWSLWPESGGRAFGNRLLDLSWYDAGTGASWGSGEEMHGTDARNSIGSNASHGCIRLYNENIEWLYANLNHGDLVLIQN